MMAWNIFSSGAGFCFSAAVLRGVGGAEMKSPVVKRSIRIAGHKTSISLEDDFWRALKEIAGERHKSLPPSSLRSRATGNIAICRRPFGSSC